MILMAVLISSCGIWVDANSHAATIYPRVYLCDLESEIPAGTEGDQAYSKDTHKLFVKKAAAWSELGGVPTGAILVWSGLLSAIPLGYVLCDGQNGTPDLRDKFVKGAAAGQNPGGTGGATTHTHADHPTLAHSGAAVADHPAHTHQVTPNVSLDAHSGAAVSAHAGSAVADHAALAAHAHELPFQKVAGGTNVLRMLASSVFGTGTSRAAESQSAAPSANTTSAAVEKSESVSAGTPSSHVVTQPNNHTVTQPNNHVVSNPAVTSGNPSAALSHTVTQPNDHPAQSHASANAEPPYYTVAYIMKA